VGEPEEAAIVTENGLLTVTELESVANTVNENTPPVAGVPDITPAFDRLVPAGAAPLLMLQIKGRVPPLAVKL
jgi:hypothetical protein